jgi:hypothetical protein
MPFAIPFRHAALKMLPNAGRMAIGIFPRNYPRFESHQRSILGYSKKHHFCENRHALQPRYLAISLEIASPDRRSDLWLSLFVNH